MNALNNIQLKQAQLLINGEFVESKTTHWQDPHHLPPESHLRHRTRHQPTAPQRSRHLHPRQQNRVLTNLSISAITLMLLYSL